MDPFEIKDTLESFRIIADTREQNTPRASDRFAAFGVPVQRATLAYCDYCGNVTLPDGSDLLDISSTLRPKCCIERKMSLDELAMCFTRGRDRFRREFEKVMENGAKCYLLVENGSFEAIEKHRYRSKYNEKAFMASLIAWTIRYDLSVIFCRPAMTGTLIREILYRDIKERMERGEFG